MTDSSNKKEGKECRYRGCRSSPGPCVLHEFSINDLFMTNDTLDPVSVAEETRSRKE